MMVKNHNNDDEMIANLMQPTRPCEVPMFAGALEIISLLILLMIIAHGDEDGDGLMDADDLFDADGHGDIDCLFYANGLFDETSFLSS